MIRVVHLFDLKRTVPREGFIEWLDAKLSTASRQFGCVERKTWILMDGFVGDYNHPKPVRDRPRYVTEAYWRGMDGPEAFRHWLTHDAEGKQVHDRWFSSIENHTVLRYVDGWEAMPRDE